MSNETTGSGISAARGGVLKSLGGLVVALAVVFAAASCGALFMPDAWYAALTKPPLNPPNWIFGPVWTTLYVFMAISVWLIWRRRGEVRIGIALTLFAIQLVLNSLWTPLFFGAHQPLAALLDLVLLWLVIVATIVRFWPISRVAALLLAPYLAWVSFAGYLNAGLWWLNR
jgi:tryptophan-rich sensory protein